MKTEQFGLHLMIDAYGCDQEVLDDPKKLYAMFEKIVALLQMHILVPPHIIRADSSGHKDPGGWTGFVIIAESHISCHTFVKRGFATLDIYSCNEFDTEPPLTYLKELLKTDDMEVYIQKRGLRYPSTDLPIISEGQ